MARKPQRVSQLSLGVLHGRAAKGAAAGTRTPSGASARGISVPDEGARLASAAASGPEPVAFGSCTDVGRVREHNEDSLFVAPPLFVVADGMGGHAAGEVASELAIQTISDLAPAYPNGPMLGMAVETANQAVYNAAQENERRSGMGTTVTAAMVMGGRLVIAQVGDSRAYLLSHGTLQQLTRDHSLMAEMIEAGQLTPAEARVHPKRNFITRALGTSPTVRPDLYELNVSAGDRLLLCSDGLSGMIDDEAIARILSAYRDPQTCAKELVAAANDAGGHDNITAVVVDVGGEGEAVDTVEHRRSVITAVVIGLVAVVLIAGAIALIHLLTGGGGDAAAEAEAVQQAVETATEAALAAGTVVG